MRDVFVIADNGTRLMPTSRYRARKLLNAGQAVIYKYQPFTIRLSQASQASQGRKPTALEWWEECPF